MEAEFGTGLTRGWADSLEGFRRAWEVLAFYLPRSDLPQGPTVMSPLEKKRHWMLGPQPDHSGAQCAGSDHMPGVTRLQVLSQLLQFEEHFPLQVKEGNDSSLIL